MGATVHTSTNPSAEPGDDCVELVDAVLELAVISLEAKPAVEPPIGGARAFDEQPGDTAHPELIAPDGEGGEPDPPEGSLGATFS